LVLYSIIPVEVVFSEYNEKDFYSNEIEYEGERVEVTPLTENKCRINRTISTCPKAYLNPKLMPGSIIERVSELRK